MKSRSFLLVMIIFFVFVFSLSTKQTVGASTVSDLTTTFDGTWQGTGSNNDGLPFTLTLIIQNGSLTGLLYQFPGTDGVVCHDVVHSTIPLAEQPKISEGKLNATLGNDVVLSAFFLEDGTAFGHLTAHWHDRQPRCNGDYEVDWTAIKQAIQVSGTTPQSKPGTAHPFQTFFQILIFGLSNGSVLALNAIGVTLIYSTVRTLNLAHGDVFALASAFVTSMVNIIGITQKWQPLQ